MRYHAPDIVSHSRYRVVTECYRQDEAALVESLRAAAGLDGAQRAFIQSQARTLAEAVRRQGAEGGLDAFLHAYDLSSREGVALMCLAEALLRIPDAETRDRLIRDKIGSAQWSDQREQGGSLFVNASTWALMLTGRLIEWHEDPGHDLLGALRRRLERSGEPFVREAVTQAMRILGRQFVMGRTIEEALTRAGSAEHVQERHTFDMLGEAARTAADAEGYFERYLAAISAVGAVSAGAGPVRGPGVSVKLSALHPRFEVAQYDRLRGELLPRLITLARAARELDIALTVDAEEAERLDITLDMVARLCAEPGLAGWEGLGLAVQAYQKRAHAVLDLLADLADGHGRRLQVRLVKGAYWDSEIRAAQVRGLAGYPVFTRKANTDLSYLACARRLLAHADRLTPAFATHNAHTVAAILEMAGEGAAVELQRLHGMGRSLHAQVVDGERVGCRVYAPVGSHEALLPYLVRRLLENGANVSFVNRVQDLDVPIETLIQDPVETAGGRHGRIPLPEALFEPDRRNSSGVDLSDMDALGDLARRMRAIESMELCATSLVGGEARGGRGREVFDPADRRRRIGQVADAESRDIADALRIASGAAPDWGRRPADERAARLERAADVLEEHLGELVALCCREGGRTIPDGIAEVREAADFCRYYAARARACFGRPIELPGPTGELNRLSLHGRGVFACISPWNFPVAIFTGQIAAALSAGNAVIAKPAEQTPLTAHFTLGLLHRAGIPADVLQLLIGDGPSVGAPLVADARISGVAFTGGLETARIINRALAARPGPIVPLIAETGGQNAMILDSSALAEQVVADILVSSFQSAGQRCSALRVLYVQEEQAPRLLEMLAGAMAELRIGDPWDLSTDVGPVIDEVARETLAHHCARMEQEGRLIYRCSLPPDTGHGSFFPPQAFEIDDIGRIGGEVFGPVLHVIRYPARHLDMVIEAVNATGYGLTFGIHSRIDRTVAHVTGRVRAGNLYVNRNMIGAVVGAQPFGGEGLSGTGPKAGGPHYLQRFATERVVSIDTSAAGGNAALLDLASEPGR